MVKSEQAILTYAVRVKVVLKYLSQLTLIQAGLTLVPVAVALFYGEYTLGLRFALVAIILSVVAIPWIRLPAPVNFQDNEALVVTALAFLISTVAMIYPFMGAGIPLQDALFEAVSAITTTGLSTLATVEDKSKTFLFARAWMQWCGGLGIVVLSIAILFGHQRIARRLLGPLVEGENLAVGIRTYARRVMWVYLWLTVLVVLLLWSTGLDGFTAVVHSLSAVSTGGFSSADDSLAALGNGPAAYIITLAGLCGAVALSFYYRVYHQGWRQLAHDEESKGLLFAIMLCCLLLMLFMVQGGNQTWTESLRHAFLLGISAQTTTGFTSMDVAQLDPASKVVMMGSMMFGGEVGSTAGGVKIVRLLILLRLIQFIIRRTGMPSHAVYEPRLAGRRIDASEFSSVLALLGVFSLVIFMSWLSFIALGYDPLNSLFEVISATGTVGLSTGIVGPELHPVLKGVLCFDMLAGRLEIIALLVLLYPGTWYGKRVGSV
jgi:trk system potassium uptake protein TrkH